MAEDQKTVKLTKAQEEALRFAFKRPDGIVTKPMMETCSHRLQTFEALYQRGLMSRPPMGGGGLYTITPAGRNHPAVTTA